MLTNDNNPIALCTRPVVKAGAAVVTAAAIMAGCAPRTHEGDRLPDNTEEVWHADNDIAMTVRSLADALRVGEPLDTADYNYEGILTDGQGAPLYTDLTGSPGQWTVEVTGPETARIRNLYLGDLLPEDLRQYVVQSMHLSDADITGRTLPDLDDPTARTVTDYDFGGGHIRFESRMAMAPNGLEGPLIHITLSSCAF